MGIYHSVEQLVGNTPLLCVAHYGKARGLHATLLAKLERCNPAGSAKDRVALEMLRQAEQSGALKRGGTVIEPTSGNTGIGLAAIAAVMGYRVILTMPASMSAERRAMLKAYGAELVLVEEGGMAGAVAKAEELAREIPEADVVLGIGSNGKIGEAIRKAVMGEHFTEYGEKESLSMEGERMLANEPWFAYVKVAEGCDNRCSYCAIPLIRGRFRSRPMENVIEECKELAARGVTELNLVAQDTTRYGEDIYGEGRLPELIDAVCEIEGVHWVRILYCYPDRVTDKLIDTIARQPKAVHYFDIPVQHASAHVLRDMNRRGDRRSITALCQKIREKIPDVVLRTTLIAGFPTESEEDFAELCKLVEEVRFDRLGCFAYSQEEDTPAAELEQIPEEVRRRRAEIIMELQMSAAFDFADRCTGRTLEVLAEGWEDGQYYGRSYMDAPDIDTRVYFTSEDEIEPGSYVPVLITDTDGYDLIGMAKAKEDTK